MLLMSSSANANSFGGSLWLATCYISILLMSRNFQQKKVISAIKEIKQIEITMASRFPFMEDIEEKMMMKTSRAMKVIASRSTTTNTNLSYSSFYRN